jgi:hypothetical protein
MYRQAGAEEVELAQWTAQRLQDITREETQTRLEMYQTTAGMIAGTFKSISQAGGQQNAIAFRAYQLFAIAEATIAAYVASNKALAEGGPMAVAQAWMIRAQAMLNVAMIAAAKPPSYDEGGISHARGVYQTGDIDEAHIPLKGGKVPVEMNRGEERITQVTIMNAIDPVLFDQYFASPRGKDAIINVIGDRAQSVRRIIR